MTGGLGIEVCRQQCQRLRAPRWLLLPARSEDEEHRHHLGVLTRDLPGFMGLTTLALELQCSLTSPTTFQGSN